ncbi:MAG TPA: hypothetical protein VFV89_02275 [Nocardioides sp.]|uniref:hypothetical protein n=1 Tax=Nocardioides sp. TaxID=35761 RepID=UPI002E30FBA7|nr:hypothetical protein [Nocardioides sp.]HEX5086603.1 hypothetical protein [Nocardioides sp.]
MSSSPVAWPTAAAYLLAGTIMVLGLAAPASAASEDARDARRDVLSGPKYTDDLPTRAEPARRAGDITRTTVVLGKRLVIPTTYRSIDLTGEQDFQWLLKTSTDHEDGSWIGYLTIPAGKTIGSFQLIDPLGNQPGCATAVTDRVKATVKLKVPASCLGNPAWVRVANGLTVITDSRVYEDDARRDGEVRHGWKYGPKVTA